MLFVLKDMARQLISIRQPETNFSRWLIVCTYHIDLILFELSISKSLFERLLKGKPFSLHISKIVCSIIFLLSTQEDKNRKRPVWEILFWNLTLWYWVLASIIPYCLPINAKFVSVQSILLLHSFLRCWVKLHIYFNCIYR